jgi:subfamily B ATP-binding cassette protein MsbA
MFKDLGKILRYITRYKLYAGLNVLFNVLSMIFGIFSLAMIIPFLQILFNTDAAAQAKILADGLPPFKWSGDALSKYFSYYVTDMVNHRGAEYVLLLISVSLVAVILVKNLFRYLAIFYMAPIRNGTVKDIRNEMYDKILVLPLSYYSAERKGDIMARMTNDIQEIEWSVMQSIEMLTITPLTILVYLGFLIFLSGQLTLLVFILLPITGFLIARIAKSLKRSSSKSKEHMGVLFSMIEETLGGLRIIKAFNGENSSRAKFFGENQTYTNVMNRVYRKTDLASPLSEFLGSIVLAIVMYFGGKLVWSSSHALDGAVFVTYIATFTQLIPPAKAFSTAYYSMQKGLASIDRINKILHSEVTVREVENPLTISSFEKEIEYKNVSFAYNRGDLGWAVKDVNIKLAKGKTIALVGQSGSGKSTLVDLLPRFYDPTSGEIIIDGLPIKNLSLTQLRSLMGIVTQESILFNDTVKNNIAFGMNNVTDEQVIEAAKVANAHDFIMRMENGYETNIGDRGSKLSGGERQRMSIARAILKNPPVLILDEATSALDAESERLVQDALTKLMSHRTSIVIAHRLSTIKNADEIIVMQKGSIVERGSHINLIVQNGVYKKLYDLQSFV